jgi:serine/threonine-protein kinase
MTLVAGTRLGPYEIQSAIGAGGMGEVYRARDTKLDRSVAIKILPELFAHDPDRLARFEREAKTLAALNHPNIAIVHGFEEAHGIQALVMELVEGPTLADRIAQGLLPLDEALLIAKQIAEALESAHEHGIIHRDLKPANIKVRADGTVKVLDFGLAKAFDPASTAIDASQSPTITSPAMTHMGVILGTAAYMSPEQARGKTVDKRADIWAFGCVLYEMLAGTCAFRGETVSETLAEVMKSEPRWTALPPETPAALRDIIRRCLAKDPRRRVRDIGDVRLALEGTFETAAAVEATAVAVPRLRVWQRPAPLAIAIVTLIVATGFAVWALTRPAPPRVVRLTVTPSGATALGIGDIAISPDGTRLAHVGAGAGQILVRAFDQLEPTTLQGVGAPGDLFFSPDGQWIGFFDGNTALKKVAVTGGSPVTLSRTGNNPLGASWSTDDTIIYATNDGSGLLRVAAGGGEPEVLTTPNRDQGELDHVWPEILPGGQAVLFTIATGGGLDTDQIALLDLTTREQKILIRGGSYARYVPTGHLVYGMAGTVRAVAFDLRRREVVGTPVPVLEQVMADQDGAANLSISRDGTLVYVPGAVQGTELFTLVWVDRQGREEALKAPPRRYTYPRLSPDGSRVALWVSYPRQENDIWTWDLERETLTRLTFEPAPDSHPVWTPDGQRLLFRSFRAGPGNLFWQAADGTGAAERLTESNNNQMGSAFSPDGTRLIFREETATTGADLMVLALEGGRRAQPSQGVDGPGRGPTGDVRPLVQTTFNELNGEISHDGRWVAYQSNESGQEEIYVRPFPDADRGRWQISTGGGTRPLWARSDKELFYIGLSGAMMSASVEGGSTFRAGNPTRLFEGRHFRTTNAGGRTYDVSPDGRRFLIVKGVDARDETAAPPGIIVVQNWFEELKRLVPK